MMDKLKQLSAYIPSIGILLILCSLPFPYGNFQRYSLYAAGIGYLIDYGLNQRWREWRWSREKWVFIFFMAFYLCVPVWQLFDSSCTWLFYKKMETYLPFFVLGLFGFLGFNRTLKPEYVASVMVLTCLYVGGLLVCRMPDVSISAFPVWREALNETRIQTVNSHMVVNMYCNMTLVFVAWSLLESSWPRWWKVLLAVLSLGIVAGILVSEGRTGQLTVMPLIVAFLIAWLYKRSYLKWFPVVMVVLLAGFGLFWHYSPRYHDLSVQDNPRLYIWRVGHTIIEEKPIAGWGVSSAREEFIKRGNENEDFRLHYLMEYEYGAKERYGVVNPQIIHPHNAFMETAMEFGFIGLVIFLLCLVLPPLLLPIGVQRWYLAACVFAFAMQAMFECLGFCLLPIWLPLLSFIWRYNSQSDCPSALSDSRSGLGDTCAVRHTCADGRIE